MPLCCNEKQFEDVEQIYKPEVKRSYSITQREYTH